MAIYQIKLTPVNAYFFGGEKHSKNDKNPNGFEMDYFAKSEFYPQQTMLLGALRYYLLLKNELLNPQKQGKVKEAGELIGSNSFIYDDQGIEQDFGAIKSLSSLYFFKSDLYFKSKSQKYIIAPLDEDFELKIQYGNYFLDGYGAKEGYFPCLINIQDKSKISLLKKNEQDKDFIFSAYPTVGNKKGEKGKSEDDGFYKLTMYRLNEGWSFAFEAEIDLDLEEDKVFIPFGAEKQMFSFEILKIEQETNLEISQKERTISAIYCLSDCFVNEEIWQFLSFAINEKVSFRNLQSKTSSENYSSFSKGYKRGSRYNLLRRGSVLYFENDDLFNKVDTLFKNANAEKIGFNKIQIISKN